MLTISAAVARAWAGKKPLLYVAGEEAGGNLAAALALMARDQQAPALAGQILLSPMLDALPCHLFGTRSQGRSRRIANGRMAGTNISASPAKAAHPYASPIGLVAALPVLRRALLVTAEDDLLRDETSQLRTHACGNRVSRCAEHLLPAPTGWPCALYHDADG